MLGAGLESAAARRYAVGIDYTALSKNPEKMKQENCIGVHIDIFYLHLHADMLYKLIIAIKYIFESYILFFSFPDVEDGGDFLEFQEEVTDGFGDITPGAYTSFYSVYLSNYVCLFILFTLLLLLFDMIIHICCGVVYDMFVI